MTARTKHRRPARRTPDERLARLQEENARLRAELRALKGRKGQAPPTDAAPALPAPDADGNYPAEQTLGAILARQIVRRRQAADWTQVELAERAGVRRETITR